MCRPVIWIISELTENPTRVKSVQHVIFQLLLLVGVVNAGSPTPGESITRSTFGQPPNIVLILADDLGYGDVGCYNSESHIPTPNLDQRAREGMRFTDAHSPCTVGTPTRYSLMTGQMAFRVPNGGRVFTGAGGPSLITPDRTTLPKLPHEQGYSTACVGKWHIGLTFYDKDGKPIHKGLPGSHRVDRLHATYRWWAARLRV